jgi:hypothetical protein
MYEKQYLVGVIRDFSSGLTCQLSLLASRSLSFPYNAGTTVTGLN